MAQIKNFSQTFEVKATAPLDDRLVVDKVEDLYSISYPYTGMAVTVKGSSDLWVFTGNPGDQKDASKWKKVSGGGLSEYSLPIMTSSMVESALADENSGFTKETDYIAVDDGTSLDGETENNTITSVNGTYLDIMMRSIRALQAEVAKLKNSFEYGIQSYTDENTAMSATNERYSKLSTDEPLWAIEEGYLSEIPSSDTFNSTLDFKHSFTKSSSGTIDASIEGQLTFNECTATFSDQNQTLKKNEDSKMIVFLTTTGLDINVNLTSLTDSTKTKIVSLSSLIENGTTVNQYGIMAIVSRKLLIKKTGNYKGFNYFYASIINYENNEKLVEGYLTDNGTLGFNSGTSNVYEIDDRYFISSIDFTNLTLYKMKFYTKYEDFNEEVISSQPNENDYKYQAAHITIRSVKTDDILEKIKSQLQNNEMVWVESTSTLYIKSNNKFYPIGSVKLDGDSDSDNKEIYDIMTTKELADALQSMGIVVGATYDSSGEIITLNDIKINQIADVTFVNNETGNKFTYSADTEGNLVCKVSPTDTIESKLDALKSNSGSYDVSVTNVRGFIAEYLMRTSNPSSFTGIPNGTTNYGNKSDRLRISSFYAPINTDTVHGCTHSFIELENTSDVDIPLTGVYLHFYNPYESKVYHLELDGVIKSGGTYLVRGAKHAEFEDASAFIKVKTFDKEWYEKGKAVSFEQVAVETTTTGSTTTVNDDSPVKLAYRFCLTYGLPELSYSDQLVKVVEKPTDNVYKIGDVSYSWADFPNNILNPRFIDGCNFSTTLVVSNKTNGWYCNGLGGTGITITPNSMFRLMFELDPAKQAYNGWTTKDGSRIRYNKDTDLQVLSLDKEFIGYPFSTETIKIDRYTPKASFDNRTVMTDKSKLDSDKPNMITCSLGIDVYTTRCFNWISCGAFDEYIWVRKQGDSSWTRFQSYTKVSSQVTQGTGSIHRKEFLASVNNTVYARIINRFPGDNVLFTSHKCILEFDAVTTPTVYEYVVGRPDKDLNPDSAHTNIDDIYTFTLYPNTYEGRTYQITDQQGFHWIEYQVWAAAAEYLDSKITSECASINSTETQKVFPILINTGDMTQSGARINEWIDYYNGGKKMFKHLEQMNCVGNNDLCPINYNSLGTGNDSDKSNPQFFHYFYCFEIPNDENLIIKSHTANTTTTATPDFEDRYIPSTYYFKTKGVFYLVCNSELTETTCSKWFGLYSSTLKDSTSYSTVNVYTGIEVKKNGKYDKTTTPFTPIYETLYSWLSANSSDNIGTEDSPAYRRIVMACHEMPFTVITKASLSNGNSAQLPCTRNFPTNGSRLGSNMNQLNSSENNGIFWCSRLLEQFGCKICIGGHKHTYALSYPIKENYSWTYNGTTTNSSSSTKPMGTTLADEADGGEYTVNWQLTLDSETMNDYNIDTTKINTTSEGTTTLNSTKTPYIPESLYTSYGETTFNNGNVGVFRCCKPLTTSDEKYDGFVNYSMCQATGYKLKSNKELPSTMQLFSKIIPKTTHTTNSITGASEDKPNANQLYPMYSILEFSGTNNSILDVKMGRICGIFAKNGKDTFTQTSYGKVSSALKTQYLVTTDASGNESMYGKWIEESALSTETNKYLYILY